MGVAKRGPLKIASVACNSGMRVRGATTERQDVASAPTRLRTRMSARREKRSRDKKKAVR